MVVNVAEAIEFVKDIAENEQVKITAKRSLKGGMIVGCAATFGALCLGPAGLAVGGAVGGLGAAIAAKDTFKPLPVVIAEMSPQEKQILARRVERIVQDFEATDIASLGMMLVANDMLKARVVQELMTFLTQEMSLAIA